MSGPPTTLTSAGGRPGDIHVEQRGAQRLLDRISGLVLAVTLTHTDHRDASPLHDGPDVGEVEVHEPPVS